MLEKELFAQYLIGIRQPSQQAVIEAALLQTTSDF
jgi:hypothetical protein